MSATGTRHAWTVVRLNHAFTRRDDVFVSPQSTFQIGQYGGPEPDFVVLRADAPQDRLPSPDHAVLIVEVADTSLAHDRYTKAPLYARANIPEYWIVDPEARTIERLKLTGTLYAIAGQSGGDDVFAPSTFRGLRIPLRELWSAPTPKPPKRLAKKKTSSSRKRSRRA